MDFLGWYSTGDRPTLAEIAIHRQITDINESPLFLQLSPGTSKKKIFQRVHSWFNAPHPPHLLNNRRVLTCSDSEFMHPEMWGTGPLSKCTVGPDLVRNENLLIIHKIMCCLNWGEMLILNPDPNPGSRFSEVQGVVPVELEPITWNRCVNLYRYFFPGRHL
jgi:hypothetical protein